MLRTQKHGGLVPAVRTVGECPAGDAARSIVVTLAKPLSDRDSMAGMLCRFNFDELGRVVRDAAEFLDDDPPRAAGDGSSNSSDAASPALCG